jgi:ABC-2 type transport system ATP-binding protein
MTDLAIETEGLVKVFGSNRAVDGIDLRVPAGTVYGVLGPNGAGKTTAVKMLATLLRPDGGRARVFGKDVVTDADAVRGRVSLTGQYASVDEDLTGMENLTLLGRLLGHRRPAARDRAAQLLAAFGLTEAADRQVKKYSGGMRRRLDIAASIVVTPELLFLDEPTTGLDPHSRNGIWDAVRGLASQGTTVLLTTQYLEEADQLADDIVLIDEGRAAHRGTPAELKATIGNRAEVVVADPALLTAAAAVLDQLTGSAPVLDPERRTVGVVTTDVTLTLPRLVRAVDAAGVGIVDASLRPPTLDEVFLRLTHRKELAA